MCVSLQVDQQGRNDLLHVTRLPDVHQQLVVHRLPDDALQTADPGHADAKHTKTEGSRVTPQQEVSHYDFLKKDGLVLDAGVFVFRMAHFTEARHEEVVAAMIRRRVLLDVCKLHKLHKTTKRCKNVPVDPSALMFKTV